MSEGQRRRAPAGTAVCLIEGCDWTAEGPERFHAAVEHREETGHPAAASLKDGPGDDTGQRVEMAFRGYSWGVR